MSEGCHLQEWLLLLRCSSEGTLRLGGPCLELTEKGALRNKLLLGCSFKRALLLGRSWGALTQGQGLHEGLLLAQSPKRALLGRGCSLLSTHGLQMLRL